MSKPCPPICKFCKISDSNRNFCYGYGWEKCQGKHFEFSEEKQKEFISNPLNSED